MAYTPKYSPLYGMQAEAMAAMRGLWADNEPVPPWDWGSPPRTEQSESEEER